MYLWSRKEMEDILLQLEERGQLFERCTFCRNKEGFSLLGTGGFACVYETFNIKNHKKRYALKVIGFGDKHVDSDSFQNCVRTQKNIGSYRDSILQIYDYKELHVELDKNNRVISVLPGTAEKPEGDYITLQFILMEKCEPILTYNKIGKAYLTREGLRKQDKKEILKLAYDVGKALTLAHNNNIIHRDVKLENVFYDAKKKVYKLGDFGIAKVTDNGMASTVAYTKGYGAPEVVISPDDKYDNTADIYSFGILLYLLLNDLKFPDSDDYHSNSTRQYSQGYVLPKPCSGPEELIAMVTRMCKYDPDERYQSADELLDELEGLFFGKGYQYKKQHRNAAVAIGTLFLLSGTIILKLTLHPELMITLNIWMYIFLGLALLKSIQDFRGKELVSIGIPMFVLGMVLLFAGGFAWWKLILLLVMVFSSGIVSGQIAGVIGVINLMTLIEQHNGSLPQYTDYAWPAPTLLSLGVILTLQVFILKERDRKMMPYYFKANFYWVCMFVFYLALILHAWTFGQANESIVGFLPFGKLMSDIAIMFDIGKVGIVGAIFVLLWNVREWVLYLIHKNKRPDIN